ncbi:ABC transporter permease [Macrococcoides goetzii]|nr:ABC transporter permease [Macrococcus goetzii]TDM40654.1 ABC transporter permease [Macrococcus goetzii]TDM45308.1 ABC transporter permease [Macrococcus goetzii]TDM49211.1 ABC transporter permease [Macrococcus goetzii]
MRQFKAMLKYEMIDLSQRKSLFILSTLLPVIFFLVFSSMMKIPDKDIQQYFVRDYMLSMTTFSLTSFAIITFPLEMINDKQKGWSRALFRTPLNPLYYYLCKVIKILMMYMLSILIVFLVGHFVKGVNMSTIEWLVCYAGLLFGGIIFLTLGILLSQFKDAQKVSTFGNILYLGLAMLGGLWFPVMTFPDWLQPIAKLMPTYNFKNIAAGQFDKSYPFESIGILLIYAVIFIMVSIWLRKRSEVI